jgi:hypothetical protein
MSDGIKIRPIGPKNVAYEIKCGREIGNAFKLAFWKVLDLDSGEFHRHTIHGTEEEALARFAETAKRPDQGWGRNVALVRLEAWMIVSMGENSPGQVAG